MNIKQQRQKAEEKRKIQLSLKKQGITEETKTIKEKQESSEDNKLFEEKEEKQTDQYDEKAFLDEAEKLIKTKKLFDDEEETDNDEETEDDEENEDDDEYSSSSSGYGYRRRNPVGRIFGNLIGLMTLLFVGQFIFKVISETAEISMNTTGTNSSDMMMLSTASNLGSSILPLIIMMGGFMIIYQFIRRAGMI